MSSPRRSPLAFLFAVLVAACGCPVGPGCESPAIPEVAGSYVGEIAIASAPGRPPRPTVPGNPAADPGIGDSVTLMLIAGSMAVDVTQTRDAITVIGRIDLVTGDTVHLPPLTGTISEEWVFASAEETWTRPRNWGDCGATTITSSKVAFELEYTDSVYDYQLSAYTPVPESARVRLVVWESWSSALCGTTQVAGILRR